jgi:2-phospho-L-lactate guanylyltransferase
MNVAVLPVKRRADSLTRLAGLLSPGEREELATRLCRCALAVLGSIPKLNELIVVSIDQVVLDAACAAGARILREPDQVSHSHSADGGIEMALGLGAKTVLSAAIDLPLATSVEYEGLLETTAQLSSPSLVVVPSLDGTGTNALVRTPPDVIASTFGPGSFERHIDAGRGAKAEVRTVRPSGIVLDLDTPEDLLVIGEHASETNDVLDCLGEIGAFDRARAIVGETQCSRI